MADHMAAASEVLQVPAAAERAQREELSLLAQNLRETVNDPNHSDVRFVCRDGGKVHASRLLLVARSSMLQRLLTNGMVESRLTEIPLPDITSLGMLTVVEFLYTGAIVQNKLTLVSAFQTVHASRFLMLDRLEAYVMLFLAPALVQLLDFDLLSWCFTQFAELSAEGKHVLDDLVTADLIRDMATNLHTLGGSSGLNSLASEAFNLYLDATKSGNSTTVSFKEYMRLRTILLWACFRTSPEAEVALRACLPDEQHLMEEGGFAALTRCDKPPAPVVDLSPLEPGLIRQLQTSIGLLDHGWSTVRLQCIHPQILVKVLDPLDIIPPPLFLAALKYQVVRAGEMSTMRWHKSVKDLGFEVMESGLLLHVDKTPLPGFPVHVRATMPINHGLCEWDIMVAAPCGLLYIGIYAPNIRRFSKSALHVCNKHWSRYLSSQGRLCVGDTTGELYCKSFGQSQDCTVRVHVDMKLRTCAFTVDGQRLGVAWSELPQEVYPVVVPRKQCKVRIRLVSDADFM